jgi:biotin carboxyl carrier protein
MNYRVSLDELELDLELDPTNALAIVEGESYPYSFNRHNGRYYFRYGSKQWVVTDLEINGQNVQFRVNGRVIKTVVKNEEALLLESLGMKAEQESNDSSIVAPMPGKVLSIQVQTGDTVQKGETLIVLEAMKMENEIKSPKDGVIQNIRVEVSQTVEKQTLLLELD